MKFEDGLPQLINLIIGRSMLHPSSKGYDYLNERIREAVRSFVVQPTGPFCDAPRMADRGVEKVHLPDVMAALTSAYERLQTSGIETKDVRTLMAKLVDAVVMVPKAGPCLMRWSLLFRSRKIWFGICSCRIRCVNWPSL